MTESESRSAGPVRILLSDDEPTLRAVISQVLVNDGYEVSSVGSGEEALRLFRARPFSIVLTDIVMGKLSGLDLLQEVKLLDPDTVVILMTSHATLDTTMKALQQGAYDFLTKPFDDISNISAVIARAAEKVQMLREKGDMVAHLKKTTEALESLNQQLQEIAIRDGMTGLFNHKHFRDCLEREIQRSQRHGHMLSLVFMDVDRFKNYNDTHGHLQGDKLLRILSTILRDGSRSTSILARYGGEEFVLLLPETDKSGATVCAENIRRAVETHPFEGRECQPGGRVTLSLGVATFPADGADGNLVIAAADDALYKAKREGRNRVATAGSIQLVPGVKG